jgi:arylsulfatase A-like enzyme
MVMMDVRAALASARILGILAFALATPALATGAPAHHRPTQRNVIIFVADGLRYGSVNPQDAPTLLSIRQRGVHFTNSHSLYPTLTTPNAAGIATGHTPGDTGDFSNAEYIGFPIFNHGNFAKPPGSPTPFLENDFVLADVDDHFANGNFLNEESLLAAARAQGFNTAAIGKLGPVAIQDVSQLDPKDHQFEVPRTVILDDSTGATDSAGKPLGVPVPPAVLEALEAAGLGKSVTARKQPTGDVNTPGTLEANVAQQQWFIDATTKAVLPGFVRSGRPFVLVYWSRDPDGSQHNQGDSLNKLQPGINGPTSRAAVANADANLKQLLDFIDSQPALRANTDVFVTSDHGFATISKHEIDAEGHATHAYATQFTYVGADGKPEVVPGWLPAGFLAIDLAHALQEPLFDPDSQVTLDGVLEYEPVDPSQPPSATSRQRPLMGDGLIGGTGLVQNPLDVRVIVVANGGSDLIYIPDQDRGRARRIVEYLTRQDYVGALFVDESFGKLPGTLPLSAVALEGSAQMPRPSIAVSFRTFLQEPGNLQSGVQIADTPLQEGQGMHGSLSRDNTLNNMAALGPDFKQRFADPLPVGNADIAPTLAHVLHLKLPGVGKLRGRLLSEALVGGPVRQPFRHRTRVSPPADSGLATVLQFQEIAGHRYFDAACSVNGHVPAPAGKACREQSGRL